MKFLKQYHVYFFVVIITAFLLASLAAIGGMPTRLYLQHNDEGKLTLRSSTGNTVEIPVSTDRRSGIMSNTQSKFVRQQIETDNVVVSGLLIDEHSLRLITSENTVVVVPIWTVTPVPFTRLALRSEDTIFDGSTDDVYGESSTNIIPIPNVLSSWTPDTSSYLGVAVPEDQPDIRYVSMGVTCPGFFNNFSSMIEGTSTFTYNSVEYKYWRFFDSQIDLPIYNFCLGTTHFNDYP